MYHALEIISRDRSKYFELLDKACDEGDLREIIRLLPLASRNDMDYVGSRLHLACKISDKASIILLNHGYDNHELDSEGSSPFHIACSYRSVEVVEAMYEHGADVNTHSLNGNTPLTNATFKDNLAVVEFLLSKGANINESDQSGDTALHLTSFNSCSNILEFLVGQGADMEETNHNGDTPLIKTILSRNSDNARVLVSLGADIEVRSATGGSVISTLLSVRDLKTIEFFLMEGAPIFREAAELAAFQIRRNIGQLARSHLVLEYNSWRKSMESLLSSQFSENEGSSIHYLGVCLYDIADISSPEVL